MKTKQVVTVQSEDKPDVPEAFPDSLALEPAVKAGLAFCESRGKSPEGYIKAKREARRLAWRVALLGGTTAHWCAELGQIAAHLADADRRLARAKLRGLPELAATLETQVESLNRRAVVLRTLTEAAGPAAVENQATRRKVLDQARRAFDGVTTEVNAYRRGYVPVELVDRHQAAQEAVVAAEGAFDSGALELDGLSAAMEEARAGARGALGHAIAECAHWDGVEAKRLILGRVELYASFPERIPDEVVGLYEAAMRAGAVAAQLGEPDGQRAFWGGIGQEAGEILEVRLGVFVENGWMRRIPRFAGKADNRVSQGTNMNELRKGS
jgi:hypothetical protein